MNKIFLAITLLAALNVNGQNIMPNRFYTNNYSIINPSCIYLYEYTSIHLFTHQQWINVKNHPYSQGIVANGTNQQAGWGVSLLNNRWGNMNNFSLRLNYAYRAKLNDELNFAAGLGLSINQFSLNQTNYTPTDVNDPALSYSKESSIVPNFNTGVVLYNNVAHIGLSVLNVLQNNYKLSLNENEQNKISRYFTLHSTYRIKVSDNIDIQPSLLLLKNSYQKIYFNFSTTAIYNEKYSLGLSIASNKELGISAGIVYQQFSFSYSYGFNSFLKIYLPSSYHEISLGYKLKNTASHKLL